MHVFSKTKCIFKYKCMHVHARGYGDLIMTTVCAEEGMFKAMQMIKLWTDFVSSDAIMLGQCLRHYASNIPTCGVY